MLNLHRSGNRSMAWKQCCDFVILQGLFSTYLLEQKKKVVKYTENLLLPIN